ncbi:hypothetical protein PBI_SCTP2_80 [Salicola phage SCTP-2]|nr:hypothetical protein PBI_SCTP2_80 [Salicola phage SCTP-2]
MNYKEIFENWFNTFFSNSDYKIRMENTVESSPYHLEDNVWVHTQMVVSEYMNCVNNDEWTRQDFMGAIAASFHDTGKPHTEEEFYDDKHGKWKKRYSNHEYYSGGLFIDFALGCYEGNWIVRHYLTDDDIYNVWVMIAYHMPYQYNNDRLRKIKTHCYTNYILGTYYNFIQGDMLGRIYHNSIPVHKRQGKFAKFKRNMDSLDNCIFNLSELAVDKNVMLLCGVTGVGKTSIAKETMDMPDTSLIAYHSMDECRYQFYGYDNYEDNFKASCEDSDFANREYGEFTKKLKENAFIIVDNTHISFNRRKKYLQHSKKIDVYKSGILKVVSYHRNVKQCMNRTDKYIGQNVIDRMYFAFQPILTGEFDDIKVYMEYD